MTEGARTSSSIYPNIRRRGKQLGPPWPQATNATISDLNESEAAKQERTDIDIPAEGPTVYSEACAKRWKAGKTSLSTSNHPNKQGRSGGIDGSARRGLDDDAADLGLMGFGDVWEPGDGRSTQKTSSRRGRKKSVRHVGNTSEELGGHSAFRQNSFDIVLNRSTQVHSGTESADTNATAEEEAYYAIEL